MYLDENKGQVTMKTTISTALLLAAAALVGCHSNNDSVSYGYIHHHLTPELEGTVERPVDISRNFAVASNENFRMLHDDIARTLYTDHPSRLSPFPITYTSGMPR